MILPIKGSREEWRRQKDCYHGQKPTAAAMLEREAAVMDLIVDSGEMRLGGVKGGVTSNIFNMKFQHQDKLLAKPT